MEALRGMTHRPYQQVDVDSDIQQKSGGVTILGTGLLATAFAQHFSSDEAICVFARGVSNSSETQNVAFDREARLLEQGLAGSRRLLYFSSCALASASDGDSPYFAHKRRMEKAVLEASPLNLVLRLPQVVGRTSNPHTLTNFLHGKITQGQPFTVWARAERNLIDAEDIARIATDLVRNHPGERMVAVAAARSMTIAEIVKLFERVLGLHAAYTLEDRGNPLPIDNALCMRVATKLGIDLGDDYPEQVLRKYYAT